MESLFNIINLLWYIAFPAFELYILRYFIHYHTRKYHYIIYILLFGFLIYLERHYIFPSFAIMLLELTLPFLFGLFFMGFKLIPSAVGSILATTIIYLSNGITASIFIITKLYSYSSVENSIINMISFLFLFFFPLPIAWSLLLYMKKLFLGKMQQENKYIVIFILPILLILFVCNLISTNIYGKISVQGETLVDVIHWKTFFIHIMSYFCLLAILYAYHKLTTLFQMETKVKLLAQQTYAQKNYIQEAQSRYEQTRSFRHDIKNHLSVLEGLLRQNHITESIQYLEQLEKSSNQLTLPYQTGIAALNVLLESKLSFAVQNGISTDCNIKIPENCTLDEMDLCVIFANALDNALKACIPLSDNKYIKITGQNKGDFFMVEIENSFSPLKYYLKGEGIGLSNIQAIVEKYNGAIHIEKTASFFRLNILFVIS